MKDLSGSLRKNDRKEKDTHPDVRGSANIGGVEYWISGWKKEGDEGPWYSLAFSPKEAARPQTARATAKTTDGDDIPW